MYVLVPSTCLLDHSTYCFLHIQTLSVTQAATIDELIENDCIRLTFLELRSRIQQTQFDGSDTVEVVAQVEQLQVRSFLGIWSEMPDVLHDIIIRPGSDDLNIALHCCLDLLCSWN